MSLVSLIDFCVLLNVSAGCRDAPSDALDECQESGLFALIALREGPLGESACMRVLQNHL